MGRIALSSVFSVDHGYKYQYFEEFDDGFGLCSSQVQCLSDRVSRSGGKGRSYEDACRSRQQTGAGLALATNKDSISVFWPIVGLSEVNMLD